MRVATATEQAVRFNVPGDPVAWARAGQKLLPNGRVMKFTPKTSAQFRNLVRMCAVAAGVRLIDGPVELTVIGYWTCPKSRHRKRDPRPAEWRDQKPDWDNLGKQIGDALNGIAYADDAQVARAVVETRTAAQGEAAKTTITVRPLPPLGDA